MSHLDASGYEVLALSCHDERCPTLYRDPGTGRVGVRGYTGPGEGTEAIVWMGPAQWAALRGV